MQPDERGRPAANRAATSIGGDLKLDRPTIPPATDNPQQPLLAIAELDAMAEAMRGYFVVQVTIDDAGHRRTTLYRSAGAAEQAVKRARARGRFCHVSLCQLLPVGTVVLAGGQP